MKVSSIIVGPDQEGQRIDNFLMSRLKGLPKSRLYRALRTGEVRINKCRAKPSQRLQLGDQIRVPPLRVSTPTTQIVTSSWVNELPGRILFENDELLIIDKPSGIPVHGGSGLEGGLIEALRQQRPQQKFLELIHRLDRETSGCLLIAKKRQALLLWQQLLAQRQATKQYLALVSGEWRLGNYRVDVPLQKNILQSGERMVKVHPDGKPAITDFRPICHFENASLMEIKLLTGRTHQIRVHAAHLGHPLLGDEKYGDRLLNQQMRQFGLRRLFLHAASISNVNRSDQLTDHTKLAIGAVLPPELQLCLQRLLVKHF